MAGSGQRGARPQQVAEVRPGDRFGAWTVLDEAPSPDGRRARCRCTCGQEGIVAVATLRSGASRSCAACAQAGVFVSHAEPAPAPTESKSAVKKAPAPRRATIPVPSVKVTLPLRPEQLPRDVLPPEGAAAVPIDLVIEVDAGAGKPPLSIRATCSSRNYRRAVKAIDEYGGNATVIIQGRLTGSGELLDTGIAVQPKAPASVPSP